MRIDVITIFPAYLSPLRESLIGKAVDDGVLDLAVHNLRDWTTDRHRTVDDTPYGGGPGMVMRPDIWGLALEAVRGPVADDGDPVLVIPTPAGEPFTQAIAAELATERHLIFACGRYEGIDGRVAIDASRRMRVREISLGDYVLAGGEAAALVIIEALGRLVPGVLGNAESVVDDSFADGAAGLLESAVYTRPVTYRGLDVPPVLLSGDHGQIARFRRSESLKRTVAFRPDLIAGLPADACDAADLDVFAQLGATPPEGLAQRVEEQRAAKLAKGRRRRKTS